ncbi:MAG TPA: OmpW family outer membrane protein [Thermoanaerobaculia bacterium]|nr:OmpW family outer membrane protein [Thermoanaerobaculia bacterium]
MAVLFLMVAATPLVAQERKIQLTVWGSQVEMEGDTDLGDGFETDFDEGGGFGASVNFALTPHFSVEGSAFGLRSDAGIVFEGVAPVDLGTLNLTPIMAGVQVHPFGNSRFDLYAGAGGAYVITDDFNSRELDTVGLGRIEIDSDITYYYNLGLAFQITEGFGVAVDARQIAYEPSTRSTATGVEQDLDITPRIYSAGLRFRF